MMPRTPRIFGFVWAAAGLGAAAAFVPRGIAGQPAAPSPRLQTLSWLQGPWKGALDGNPLDEYWSPPVADSMVGVFRWCKDGALWMSEHLHIVVEGDQVVLRIKHFDRHMVGWEEKAESVALPLTTQSEGLAVFESQDKVQLTRLTYRKVGANGLVVVLEHPGRDGAAQRMEFQFQKGT